MKATVWVRFAVAGLFLAGSAVPALAQGPTARSPAPEAGFGTAVSANQLAEQRGGAETFNMDLDTISNEINEGAVLTDNSVGSNITTGANSIAGGSFAGSSGISSVIQNSGNNVIIQDATLVNITMKP